METALSLERVAQILGCDMTHCWHPFTQSATAHEPLPAVGAHGAEIYLGDGSAVIDATSSWWVNIHGHQHPYMIEKISQQLAELDQILFADLTHQSAAGLARRLAHLLPGELSRVFYSDNGSTAIETALKISVQYWHNRGERRTRILAFRGGYHQG